MVKCKGLKLLRMTKEINDFLSHHGREDQHTTPSSV